MNGPKLQLPLGTSPEWQAFFNTVYQVTYNGTRSGPTAERPTSALPGRWIGMPYFDTDLGYPVYLLVAGTTNTWVDGAGVVS